MMILNVFGDLQASPVQLSVITKPKYDHNSFVMDSCHQNIIHIKFLVKYDEKNDEQKFFTDDDIDTGIELH